MLEALWAVLLQAQLPATRHSSCGQQGISEAEPECSLLPQHSVPTAPQPGCLLHVWLGQPVRVPLLTDPLTKPCAAACLLLSSFLPAPRKERSSRHLCCKCFASLWRPLSLPSPAGFQHLPLVLPGFLLPALATFSLRITPCCSHQPQPASFMSTCKNKTLLQCLIFFCCMEQGAKPQAVHASTHRLCL